MTDWWLPLGAGLILGIFFFGGLWWTVRKSLSAPQPALWFLLSLVTRTGLTLTGFYLVSAGDWQRLLVSLCGFTVARFLVLRVAGPPSQQPGPPAPEAGHAP